MKGKNRYSLLLLVIFLFILIYLSLEAISFTCDAKKSLLVPTIVNYFTFICKYSVITYRTVRIPRKFSVSPEDEKLKSRPSYVDNSQLWSAPFVPKESTNQRKRLPSHETKRKASRQPEFPRNCRLNNCFNLNRCSPGEKLKIHIYPEPSKIPFSSISSTYQKIIHIIESSIYHEPDAAKACLFITRYDYLDRDPLSLDFQKNLPSTLPLDNGQNHIVFNLYSGTWPDYRELDLAGFNLGYSMLVKASFSYQHFRPGFDISIPLFSKNHPVRGKTFIDPDEGLEFPLAEDVAYETVDTARYHVFERKNLLVFKGKRYTHGIGSETRNALYHLHNDHDILIYTTCKHGKKWKDSKDDRCVKDNLEYDRYDYSSLMTNSTFCLIPRGRRLGSFRFLEALANGCIPVLLSNNWVKPFDDVIDWSEVLIEGDERSLLQIPEMIRSYNWRQIMKMSSRSKAIYETYFSSVERIVYTTLAIIHERIESHLSLNSFLWNLVNPGFSGFTGAIWLDPGYSFDLKDYPGYGDRTLPPSTHSPLSAPLTKPSDGYTVILFISKPILSSTIHKLVKSLSKSQSLTKILIIWALPDNPPSSLLKTTLYDPALVNLIVAEDKTVNAKFKPYPEIETYAVLSIQPDTTITSEELDFAYSVWCSFPHRLVGFTARDHFFDGYQNRWFYTSKWTNYYSMVLLDAAFYHRYYNHLYTNYISSNPIFSSDTNNWDDELCSDLLFNFLLSHVTREGPIKVTQRKRTSNSSSSLYNTINSPNNLLSSTKLESFSGSQECFTYLYNISFNYIPLIKSQTRFDPVLFKDPVSIYRKKYRKLESVS